VPEIERVEPLRPLSDVDARAIIGLLAILEGELLGEQLDPALAHRLRDRWVREDLLAEGAELAHLRRALAEMNQRVRYARGEYAEPPDPEQGATHSVVVRSEEAANELRHAAAALWAGGGLVAAPVADGRTWVVSVKDDALPMTDAFRAHQAAIEQLARDLGGTYAGYGM
jgi:hypothetical protein